MVPPSPSFPTAKGRTSVKIPRLPKPRSILVIKEGRVFVYRRDGPPLPPPPLLAPPNSPRKAMAAAPAAAGCGGGANAEAVAAALVAAGSLAAPQRMDLSRWTLFSLLDRGFLSTVRCSKNSFSLGPWYLKLYSNLFPTLNSDSNNI